MTSEYSRGRFNGAVLSLLAPLHGYALRLTGRAEKADDLVQECYLRAAQAWADRSAPDAAATGELRAWLFRIVHNLWVDDLRRTRRVDGEPISDDIAQPEPERDPFELALETLTTADVERALATLPEDAREIVELRDVQGLRYADIAEVLGIPVGTVMSRLHRARNRLREALRPSPDSRSRLRLVGGGS